MLYKKGIIGFTSVKDPIKEFIELNYKKNESDIINKTKKEKQIININNSNNENKANDKIELVSEKDNSTKVEEPLDSSHSKKSDKDIDIDKTKQGNIKPFPTLSLSSDKKNISQNENPFQNTSTIFQIKIPFNQRPELIKDTNTELNIPIIQSKNFNTFLHNAFFSRIII